MTLLDDGWQCDQCETVTLDGERLGKPSFWIASHQADDPDFCSWKCLRAWVGAHETWPSGEG